MPGRPLTARERTERQAEAAYYSAYYDDEPPCRVCGVIEPDVYETVCDRCKEDFHSVEVSDAE